MIEEQIKKVIAMVLGIHPDDINDSTNSENVANWDSLRHMNLLLSLEEAFDIEFKENDFAELTTFIAIKNRIKNFFNDL